MVHSVVVKEWSSNKNLLFVYCSGLLKSLFQYKDAQVMCISLQVETIAYNQFFFHCMILPLFEVICKKTQFSFAWWCTN